MKKKKNPNKTQATVKRYSAGGPGKKQCPNCKGDYFHNSLKVCPDCNMPFKTEGDLPGQKQLPLENTEPQSNSQAVETPPTVEASKARRKRRRKTEIVVVKTFTVKDLLAPVPKDLTIQEMADYVRAQLAAMGAHYKQIALHTVYLGIALNAAWESFDHGEWGKYLKEIGLSETTAWRARELAERVKSPDELKGLTKTEAYRAYGILKPKLLTVENAATKEEDIDGGEHPVTAQTPATTNIAIVVGDDLAEDEPDISEDVIDVVPESKPKEPAEDDEDQGDEPSEVQAIQVEFRVALENVTEAEMDAFTNFVDVAGNLERAKAIFKTCAKARSELYDD